MTVFLIYLATLGYLNNIDGNKLESYLIWLCTNIAWGCINYSRGHYDMTVMFGIYTAFCIYGIIKSGEE